jgi:hypothetical protein
MKLACTGIEVYQNVDGPPNIEVSFVVVDNLYTCDLDAMGDRIGEIFTLANEGKLDLVRTAEDGQRRCFYCAQPNNDDALECRKCGAPL